MSTGILSRWGEKWLPPLKFWSSLSRVGDDVVIEYTNAVEYGWHLYAYGDCLEVVMVSPQGAQHTHGHHSFSWVTGYEVQVHGGELGVLSLEWSSVPAQRLLAVPQLLCLLVLCLATSFVSLLYDFGLNVCMSSGAIPISNHSVLSWSFKRQLSQLGKAFIHLMFTVGLYSEKQWG